MALVLKAFWKNYNYVFYDMNDDRSRNLFPNFTTLLFILSSYMYFVNDFGPRWMKHKKPYELRNIIFLYNILQIIGCVYFFYDSLFSLWIKEYSWTCQPVDYSDKPSTLKANKLVWLYLMLKLFDLLDTVFFVLRKKDRQISGLHLYHHCLNPLCSWVCLKYFPNGHSTLFGTINCFVHACMYTYYLIAGLGPQYQKYLWWKKYVTIIQLIQFAILFVHNLYPLFTDCTYPKWIHVLMCVNAIHFIYMFGNFYYVTYVKKPRDKKERNK